jgi:hypothetical protein
MSPTGQTSMFDMDWVFRPPPVRHDHPETSFQAAESIAPVTGKLRQAVYAFAVERASYGFTDSELFTAFPDKPENSIRPRRIELVEAGRLIDSGTRRQNHRGRQCVVWAVAA